MEDPRTVELGKVGHKELPGIRHGGGERLEGQGLGLLGLGDDPAALVGAIRRRVDVELKRVRLAVLDLAGLAIVELRHALDLLEGHELAILELEALVIHAGHEGGVVVADGCDDARVGLLAVRVVDGERRPEVAEHAGEHAAGLGADERDGGVLGAAELVHLDGLGVRRVGEHHDLELLEGRHVHLPTARGDGHCGVELLQARRAGLGPVAPHVRLGEVELGGQVADFHGAGVLHVDGTHAREGHVLGDLDAEPLHPVDEDVGAREALHALLAIHGELPAVQVLINLHVIPRGGHLALLRV
mmetsp:Transcript_10527/g.34051  ORF Transcript_10527/g.34051 Transcript_10527/m.34051 type:complete len:301 (-) Transcript_10527:130-1032(-)